MTATHRNFSRLLLICLAVLFTLRPATAERFPAQEVAIVPLDFDSDRQLGTSENPYRLIELIRNPEQIKPGVHVATTSDELRVLPAGKKSEFSVSEKWKHTKALMKAAGWALPPEVITTVRI